AQQGETGRAVRVRSPARRRRAPRPGTASPKPSLLLTGLLIRIPRSRPCASRERAALAARVTAEFVRHPTQPNPPPPPPQLSDDREPLNVGAMVRRSAPRRTRRSIRACGFCARLPSSLGRSSESVRFFAPLRDIPDGRGRLRRRRHDRDLLSARVFGPAPLGE